MASARVIRNAFNQMNFISNGHPTASLSDNFFGFIGDDEVSPMSPISEDSNENVVVIEEEEEEEDNEGKDTNIVNTEEIQNFWENQHQILHAALCRTSSLETKIRNMTEAAIKELQTAGTMCGCGRQMVGSCRYCLMNEISCRLRNSGYDCAICKSKWRNFPDIPSGEHTFLDVIDNSSSQKSQIRVIIELNFRAEFEMAKGNEEYNRLVRRLPEVFVGKIERLQTVTKILCSSAKKCMKEKKMHLGPWRRHRYMQAKWLGTCKRTTSMPVLAMECSNRLPKPRASMLTVDLLEMVTNMQHRTAVEFL